MLRCCAVASSAGAVGTSTGAAAIDSDGEAAPVVPSYQAAFTDAFSSIDHTLAEVELARSTAGVDGVVTGG